MINLKKVLMELGNELVLEHGYDPAVPNPRPANTVPIKIFTDFMNESPEARVVLKRLGLDWPIAAVPKWADQKQAVE